MTDVFLAAAGPAPARGTAARWRQVALLSASSALADDPRAAQGLAATLLALDRPAAAMAALMRADPQDPWTQWWSVLAAGQQGQLERAATRIEQTLQATASGPDGRDVARRLADLRAELAALAGEPADDARFAVLGHRARPERRVLLGGRSSAAFLVEPGWDAIRLVRMAPSEGPQAANRAHLGVAEVIAAIRRGEAGPGASVPFDDPRALDPDEMLSALTDGADGRDRRLLDLAQEVRDERERLREARAQIDLERAQLRAERRRGLSAVPPPAAGVEVPRTRSQAAELLGLRLPANAVEVERAYRDAIVRCHPDRVADLHPEIRGRAEGLTVALNAARDLLAEDRAPRRSRRAAG